MADLRTQSHFLDEPKIIELLQSKRDGVLSFTNGTAAYGVPLGYAYYDNNNGTLYFGMNPSGRKFDYFNKCKHVSFTMYQTFPSPEDELRMAWWSIILDGELSQVTAPEEISALADWMDAKGLFPPGLKEKFLGAILKDPDKSNFFKMKITAMGGKEMPEYRPGDEAK
jgi:nitroimidazol reductase NimA-like FMN-containing flavoprotein (pyridoxamine 5'-phosphate oxidase superfamily)